VTAVFSEPIFNFRDAIIKHLLAGTLAIILSACSSGLSETNAGRASDLSASLKDKRILFVGAHPDDEWVLIPIMAEACLFNGASCHFLSVTRAEWGCFETVGETDLDACAERRSQELQSSAEVVNGTSELLDWEDLFYAHSGVGLRRNLNRWAEAKRGHEALVFALAEVLERQKPDVVFGLDPRHGATCNPNHRAASLLLIEAVNQLSADKRPRVLFEDSFAVFGRMTPEMIEASDDGAMFPWPERDDPMLYFDAGKTLPNGRRAIEYQVESRRAHASQFPDMPEIVVLSAAPSQMLIPLVDLDDIDPSTELCTPLDLSAYNTVDVSLDQIARRIEAAVKASDAAEYVRLQHGEKVILEYGEMDDGSFIALRDFPDKRVSLTVSASSQQAANIALETYVRLVRRFTDAPD
jgi:LmbE family N-acetylglucosaminyl deacetylase